MLVIMRQGATSEEIEKVKTYIEKKGYADLCAMIGGGTSERK